MSTPTRFALPFLTLVVLTAAPGCEKSSQCSGDFEHRAYIVSKESDEVHVIDLTCLEVVGVVHTQGQALHMGELNQDFTKIYVDSTDTNETVVIDVKTLQVVKRIVSPRHPTHLSLTRDGRMFAVMAEEDNAVMFLDPVTETVVKTLPGFFVPHFMRMSLDGKYGYVANLKSNHVTRVDLASLTIDGYIPLEGFQAPPNHVVLDDEGGFADVQIDQQTGYLYGAHRGTGRLLVYDTKNQKKLPELQAGKTPWIVYAEHPFAQVSRRHLVPNFGDQSATVINAEASAVLGTLPVADEESFGVNYSPLVPNQAFVMNRYKEEVAVVDTSSMQAMERINVGGTTETASTTADGKWIVATVSSANRVVVIDAVTHQIVKAFDNIGKYPWSVTIPRGQNYCH